MKRDIDHLMEERKLDALLIIGSEGANISRDYLTNGAHISWGAIVKKRGEIPVLYAHSMEIEEARKSGLPCVTFDEMGYTELRAQERNLARLEVTMWGRYLEKANVTGGRIGLYGTLEANALLAYLPHVAELLPEYELVGEVGFTLFQEAFTTKDDDEIARLRSVAQRTAEVQEATWDYIANKRTEGDILVHDDGTVVTIGDVRAFIISELLVRGLEDTGMIFAQGRDAGYPHSRGEDADALKLGQSIVFDLFPRERGGGYHHDTTRTWCIGYAPPEVQEAYEQVMTAFDLSIEAFGVGKPARLMQEAVLDYYEANGHKTLRSHPGTQEGYVHSLGHGIGLLIHEAPNLTHHPAGERALEIGNCITIEPGLYYPEKGYGIRVEDSFIITEKGELESLTPFRKDLVIPLHQNE